MALLEVVVMSGILTDFIAALAAGWLTGLPRTGLLRQPVGLFTYLMLSTVILVALYAVFQRLRRGEPAVRIAVRPAGGWWRELPVALLALPVFFATMFVGELLIRLVAPGAIPPVNPVLAMIRTPGDLALMMTSGVIAGGVREELQRAFIIRRSAVYFWTPWLGLLLWSALFGLAHEPQGAAAVFITALLGLEFGLLYLWRRNVFTPIVSHALFNLIVLVLYWATR
jgi:membrane protease YdiL (CAAX protease family)